MVDKLHDGDFSAHGLLNSWVLREMRLANNFNSDLLASDAMYAKFYAA